MNKNNGVDNIARMLAVSALEGTKPVLTSQLTAEYSVGGVKVGDTFEEGTTLESIIIKMLTNAIPGETVEFYCGASTEIPSGLTGLTKTDENVNTMLGTGLIKNIKTGTGATPQYTVVACEDVLKLKDWKNYASGISYMSNVTEVLIDGYRIYYKQPKNIDYDLGGETFRLEFKEA